MASIHPVLRPTPLTLSLVIVVTALAVVFGSAPLGLSHSTPAAPRPLGGPPGWSQLTPTSSPPGLAAGAAMAYDPVDGYLVLFGGCAGGDFWFSTCTPSNATWAFQNNSWTQLTTNVSPPARFYSSLVWDDASGNLLLFGGNGTASTGFLNDTWSFAHGQWKQLAPASSPPARASFGMVYDGHDGYVLLVDGEQFRTLTNPSSNTYVGADFNDSWKFSGGTWSKLNTTDNPSARDSFGITYDASLGSVVLFGGFNWSAYNMQDTWLYQAGTWTSYPSGSANGSWIPLPGLRNNPGLAYDPALGADLLFGGHAGFNFYADTWLFVNGSWTPSNSTGPSARWGTSLAYDPSYGCAIAFGGYNHGYPNDTWSFGCANTTGGNASSGNGSSGNGSSGNGSSGNGSSGNGSSGNGSSGNGSSGNGSSGNGSRGNLSRGDGSGLAPPPAHAGRTPGSPSVSTPSVAGSPSGGGLAGSPMVSPTGFLLYVLLSVGLLAFVVVVKWAPKSR
jgi:galactose oxidase-like protein